MTHSFYVTGTDTGIGKTHASCALLHAFRASGFRSVGMKPVASGCDRTPQGLRSADAEALIAASDPAPAYEACNPVAFEPPIAPHLAAHDAQATIDLAILCQAHAQLAASADRVIIEGVGGWAVPFGATLMQADLVRLLDVPVILVVGLRLGCLNHALLSARVIGADRCRLVGWIANHVDADMLRVADNIDTLRERLAAPLLGTLPNAPHPDATAMAASLDIHLLDHAS